MKFISIEIVFPVMNIDYAPSARTCTDVHLCRCVDCVVLMNYIT